MKKLLMLFLTLALLSGIVLGCGSESEKNTLQEKEVDSQAEGKEGANEADEKTAEAWPRTYVDALGNEIVIVKQPERVAVLHFGYMEYLFVLETPPTASALAEEIMSSFETLEGYVQTVVVEDLGEVVTPNLEKLLEVKPDLILASENPHADMYEELTKIAPTIVFGDLGNWENALTTYAEILGKEEKAEEYIANTKKLFSEINEKLSNYREQSFAFLRPIGKKEFGIVGAVAYDYYHDVETGFGLPAPEIYADNWEVLSLEGLAEMNPDHIFLSAYKEDYAGFMNELSEDTIWKSLSAVKNDAVYFMDVSVNTRGPLAIELAAETILASLNEE